MKSSIPHLPQTILIGVPYLHAVYASLISFVVGGGLAWYVRGRGLAGVQIDLNNVKTDVENIKTKLIPTPVVAVSAPVQAI